MCFLITPWDICRYIYIYNRGCERHLPTMGMIILLVVKKKFYLKVTESMSLAV